MLATHSASLALGPGPLSSDAIAWEEGAFSSALSGKPLRQATHCSGQRSSFFRHGDSPPLLTQPPVTPSTSRCTSPRRAALSPTANAWGLSLEVPTYRVLHNGGDFEIRKYNRATWVETSLISEASMNGARQKGSNCLSAYFSGRNDRKEELPSTDPIVTKLVPLAGPFCSPAFTVSKLLPSELPRGVPPSPARFLRPALKVVRTPPRCIAVRPVVGQLLDNDLVSEASHFAKVLEATRWLSPWPVHAFSYACFSGCYPEVNELWVDIPAEGIEVGHFWEGVKR